MANRLGPDVCGFEGGAGGYAIVVGHSAAFVAHGDGAAMVLCG